MTTQTTDTIVKPLKDLFADLIQNENKIQQKKQSLATLITSVANKQKQLTLKTDELNDIHKKFSHKCDQNVEALCELAFVDNQNTIVCKQIQTFETKSQQMTQQMDELRRHRKTTINEFTTNCLTFVERFGPNSDNRKQLIASQQRVNELKTKRDELRAKVNALKSDVKDVNTLKDLRNQLKQEINGLKADKSRYQSENFDLKFLEMRLQKEWKALNGKENSNQELIALKKELQTLDEMPESPPKATSFQNAMQLMSERRAEKSVQPFVPTLEPQIELNESIDSDCEVIDDNLNTNDKRMLKVWQLKRNRRKFNIESKENRQ